MTSRMVVTVAILLCGFVKVDAALVVLTLDTVAETITATQPDGPKSGFQQQVEVSRTGFEYNTGVFSGATISLLGILDITEAGIPSDSAIANLSNSGGFYLYDRSPGGTTAGLAISGTPSMSLPGGFVTAQLIAFFENNPTISAVSGSGGNVELVVVPEPSAGVLALVGLVTLLRRRR